MSNIDGQDLELPIPFGIDVSSGNPLPGLDPGALTLQGEEIEESLRARAEGGLGFAVLGDYDAGDLAQSGWGVIFPANADPAVREALQPLIDWRKAQAEAGGNPWPTFALYDGPDGYQPGQTVRQWLKARGVSFNIVDPALGVPFFLTLVGGPGEIPFEFQYELDLFWAAGRLAFDTAEEYARYAKSVIDYEKAATVPAARRVAVFAPRHDFDKATQMFHKLVATPLGDGAPPWGKLGQKQKFSVTTLLDAAATRAGLESVLTGGSDSRGYSLLFSGSHGIGFPANDPRLRHNQGALVCQDWEGYGRITEDHWFSAEHLPSSAKLHGLIHFLFACYGGGCPEKDNFSRVNGNPKTIAPAPLVARLPQAMLAHKNGGALAVLAHIDRAWAYSFVSDRGGAQLQSFRDVLGRLLRGERIGQATDGFNNRWAALSAELAETLHEKLTGKEVSDTELANRWVARDDARNYIILGDPAVRLRVEDMPPES